MLDQLLDHLVGDGEHCWWHLDAELSRRLQVDGELEFGRLQHRQVGWLGALEDAAGIGADLVKHLGDVGPVAHQSAGRDKITVRKSCWDSFTHRQSGKLRAAAVEECIAADEESIGALACKGAKDRIYLADRRGVENLDLQSDGGGGFLQFPQCGLGSRGVGRIDEHANANRFGHQVM